MHHLDQTCHRAAYRAVVVATSRRRVLEALQAEARAHFGHGRLSVAGIRVSSTPEPGTVLASAEFRELTPTP